MTRTHRKTTDQRLCAAALASEGGDPSFAQPERARQMADLGIGYDGLQYQYNGYRYGRLGMPSRMRA